MKEKGEESWNCRGGERASDQLPRKKKLWITSHRPLVGQLYCIHISRWTGKFHECANAFVDDIMLLWHHRAAPTAKRRMRSSDLYGDCFYCKIRFCLVSTKKQKLSNFENNEWSCQPYLGRKAGPKENFCFRHEIEGRVFLDIEAANERLIERLKSTRKKGGYLSLCISIHLETTMVNWEAVPDMHWSKFESFYSVF